MGSTCRNCFWFCAKEAGVLDRRWWHAFCVHELHFSLPPPFPRYVQLGTCTDAATKPKGCNSCCGTNLQAAIPAWIKAQSADSGVASVALDTQLRYNQTANVEAVLAKVDRSRAQLWITSKIDPK